MVDLFALVSLGISVFHQLADQNALSALSVDNIKPVSVKSVKILALEHVDSMLAVKWSITIPSVAVQVVTLEIPSNSV